MFDDYEDWYRRKTLRAKGREPAASSLRSKHSHLRLACEQASVNYEPQALAVELADRDAVEALLDALLARRSATYVRAMCWTLLSFGEYAKAKYGTSCAMSKRDVPAVDSDPETDAYSPDDIEKLLFAAKLGGIRWHLFLTTLADTGRRLNEILNIQYADIKLDAEVPHLVIAATKTHQKQYVPLSKRLQALYAEHLPELKNGINLPQQTARSFEHFPFPWGDRTATRRFSLMCHKLGIEYHACKGFRTAFITNKLAKGAPINGVAKLVGHNSLAMISRYYDKTVSLQFAYLVD